MDLEAGDHGLTCFLVIEFILRANFVRTSIDRNRQEWLLSLRLERLMGFLRNYLDWIVWNGVGGKLQVVEV
jgi:hypothetical protein